MNKSDQIGKLAEALSKFQGTQHTIKDNAINPFLKNRYADLEALISGTRANLGANGLSVSQLLSTSGVETVLLHKSGEFISSVFQIEPTSSKGLNAAQAMGVAITYARRYAYGAILGLSTDKDADGCDASNKTKPGADKPEYRLKENLRKQLEAEITKSGSDKIKLKKFFKVEHLYQLSEKQQVKAMEMILKKSKPDPKNKLTSADKFRDEILEAKDFDQLGKLNDRAEQLFKSDELDDIKSMIAAKFQELQ